METYTSNLLGTPAEVEYDYFDGQDSNSGRQEPIPPYACIIKVLINDVDFEPLLSRKVIDDLENEVIEMNNCSML